MKKVGWFILFSYNFFDIMEEFFVFGVGGGLVVDEFYLREKKIRCWFRVLWEDIFGYAVSRFRVY